MVSFRHVERYIDSVKLSADRGNSSPLVRNSIAWTRDRHVNAGVVPLLETPGLPQNLLNLPWAHFLSGLACFSFRLEQER
jgi:hypothetical protein